MRRRALGAGVVAVFLASAPGLAQNMESDSGKTVVVASLGSFGLRPAFGSVQVDFRSKAFLFLGLGGDFGAASVGRSILFCENESSGCFGITGSIGVGYVEEAIYPVILGGGYYSTRVSERGIFTRPGVQVLIPSLYPMLTLGVGFPLRN